jgi:homoserine kinase type II
MSVFTPLERPELEAFLAPYGLGRLVDFQGIAAGSENTNFFISLEQGEYVLTLIERGPSADLPFFIQLLDVLHDAGLPVPYAIPTTSGEALRSLAGKPALLQPRLAGKHISSANAEHCRQVGALLARIHLATTEAPLSRKSDRGLEWMLEQGPLQAQHLAAPAASLLNAVLAEVRDLHTAIRALPQANLHADMFRDNVLFDGHHLAGVIDFYNACCGPMLYDLAIALNDWCSNADGSLDTPRAQALLGAYAAQRPFSPGEVELWPAMLRIACLRFWLSRLIAAQSFAGQEVLIHDPVEFERRLAQRQQVDLHLPLAL